MWNKEARYLLHFVYKGERYLIRSSAWEAAKMVSEFETEIRAFIKDGTLPKGFPKDQIVSLTIVNGENYVTNERTPAEARKLAAIAETGLMRAKISRYEKHGTDFEKRLLAVAEKI